MPVCLIWLSCKIEYTYVTYMYKIGKYLGKYTVTISEEDHEPALAPQIVRV